MSVSETVSSASTTEILNNDTQISQQSHHTQNTPPLNKQQRIDTLFDLYMQYGQADYIGEPVTQLEHMIQAAKIAEDANHSKEIIVACLCHDIGHFFHKNETMVTSNDNKNWGVKNHEKLASEYLKNLGFNDLVCDLVGNHVNAKRYLVCKHPQYLANLSHASLQTLTFQGGPMNPEEMTAFESSPNFISYLLMRKIDEAAKEQHLKLPDLEHYRNMCMDCLTN
jgi:predicted HD phosphohydrolase